MILILIKSLSISRSTNRGITIQSSEIKQQKAEPKPGEKREPAHKYENYFDNKFSIDRIQPHQVIVMLELVGDIILKAIILKLCAF